MSHYSLKSVPGAKFESASFSSFGDITSQNFHSEEGSESLNSAIYHRKMGLTLKNEFLCPDSFFSTQT